MGAVVHWQLIPHPYLRFYAGDVILLDDMGTKGHLTRVNGGQQVVAVGVRVPADAG
jgi:hypothetical protein